MVHKDISASVLSPHHQSFKIISGIKEIASDYDAFLVDQWGVLHNGESAHSGAIDVLRYLKGLDKHVILISNSSRSGEASQAMLESMGFSASDYDAVVTSGMLTHDYLRSARSRLGNRVKLYSWQVASDLLDGLDFVSVEDVSAADFLLFAGSEHQDLEDYRLDLRSAYERGLILVCANPDKVSVGLDGRLKLCPGSIADYYESMGGEVIRFGKPYAAIYGACLSLLPSSVSLERICAVGDSLEHDISGGVSAGCSTVLIASGIHRGDLLPLSVDSVECLSVRKQIYADYICQNFVL